MKTKADRQGKINEKRQKLKGLSAPIRALVKEGVFHTVNEGLKEMYAEDGHTVLKSIRQWNNDGKRIKKGEKALMLWGSPRKFEVVDTETAEVDELDFYPIYFVFSNLQITDHAKGGEQ